MATGQALHGAAGKVANFGIIAAFAAFAAFPFAWMLITTFKRTTDLLDPGHNPFIYSQPPTLDNLRVLFNDTLFVRWAGNTVFIGVLVVLITLLIAVPAGYSLARLTGAIGEQLGVAMFLTYLVPPTILFIPLSRVVSILHLQDSPFALVRPDVHLQREEFHRQRRRPQLPRPRRRVLLGLAHGRLLHRQRPHRIPLQFVRGQVHRRLHGGGGEGVTRRERSPE